MNRYKKLKRRKNLKSLLDEPAQNGSSAAAAPEAPPTPEANASAGPLIVSHWKPTLRLHLVHHFESFGSPSHIPPQIRAEMDIDERTGAYPPIVYLNEFWLLGEHLIPLNDTVAEVPLTLSYSPIGLFKWQIQVGGGGGHRRA
jgi:hypothetical protein